MTDLTRAALIADLTKHHRERPADKSHPGHCACCYWPWPCPNMRAAEVLRADGDEPCMCGTGFTCMASDHSRPVAPPAPAPAQGVAE